MAPTPSSKSNHSTQLKTPQSKHRLNFNTPKAAPSTPYPHPSPNLNAAANKEPPAEHPIEVIARIRDYPDRKDKPLSVLQTNSNSKSIRVRADFGYRDFTLDGVSVSEEEELDTFYKKFVESRINGVKLGDKCTIMMYGPTGSGKSHTMFGCSKQAGIVYRSLRDILGDGDADADGGDGNDTDSKGQCFGLRTFVQVTVLEIYNEEIYDLLSSNSGGSGGGGFGFGWPKGSASKVKLEVMGKKAKNATYISGNEPGKISKEIQKVEKRRIVKSTLCNERSSRSHCLVILDVPTVGGRLMLVDMAGSENIEQAGQTGFEAKMQTAKINQGNTALKRVVESIANGDSHVPFRDSKLTMLLQDSFEDDKSKILMILCASPDPKEIHKTISTLEYGAKAKCIVRGPHTPVKEEESSSAVILGSRIAAMDEFIMKLQIENKQREKERNEAHKKLVKKEEEIAELRAKLGTTPASEEEINLKVNERTRLLRQELEKKLAECQRITNEFVELERKRMEERLMQQQEEVEILRKRLEEIELQLCCSGQGGSEEKESKDMVEASGFARRLMRVYKSEDDPGMVKSMDLDMDDQEPLAREVNIVGGVMCRSAYNVMQDIISNQPCPNTLNGGQEDAYVSAPNVGPRGCLSTVYEEEDEGEQDHEDNKVEDEEVEKEVIEEKRVCTIGKPSAADSLSPLNQLKRSPKREDNCLKEISGANKDNRLLRIQNIFTLCGNQRELSQHIGTPIPIKKRSDETETFDLKFSSPVKSSAKDPAIKLCNKENVKPLNVVGN